ncbi:sarcinarray family MAST domain-containing protein [Methanolobus bombayensis]|uniref:sarcinarray family MAST domain-containing protein n=1 Tax=Methanolobus bombayensis TaxID=38023 RepID=UPI001AE1E293|nr:sarcinarray family MAST domain-containing protein [Methanolobus bombayensis]MBP1908815.1 sarcinarray family protein [Methanolobus bombayensis]
MYKLIIACTVCLLVLFSMPASSESSNLKVDMYYNDQLHPGASIPKPLLKIGEPFKLRFEVTCYKKNFLSVMLTSIGENDFDIIKGPTPRLGSFTDEVMEINETKVFEWTVAPNEEWAGGSAPINFFYQMNDLNTAKLITTGEFTAAYVTISEEYYDGPGSTTDSTSNSEDESSSPSTPAFTALCSVFALVLAVIYKRK